MRGYTVVGLVLLGTLTGSLCSASTLSVHGVYGFSPDLNIFKGKTPQQAAQQLDEWGINAVWTGGIDEKYGKALAKTGIGIFIDIPCFQGEKHWKSHPESHPINSEGNPIKKIRWYAGVCPTQPWLRKGIIERAKRAASQEGIGGVWLDFIRYPVHWEVPEPKKEQTCFCSACLKEFEKESGISIPPDLKTARKKASWILLHHRTEWINWKGKNIARFVAEVSRAVKSTNPNALVGLFGVPWTPKEGLHEIVGQNYALLAPHVDVFSPMVYYPLNNHQIEWMSEVIRDVAGETKRSVWPILYAGDTGHSVPADELVRAIERAGQQPSQGVLLISLGEIVQRGLTSSLRLAFRKR